MAVIWCCASTDLNGMVVGCYYFEVGLQGTGKIAIEFVGMFVFVDVEAWVVVVGGDVVRNVAEKTQESR